MIPARYRVSNAFVYLTTALTALASGVLFNPAGVRKRRVPHATGRGLRIALVSEFFYPTLGGIQDHLRYFARELILRGHHPTIITPHVFGADEFQTWWPKDVPESVYQPMGYSLPLFINGSLGRTATGVRLGASLRRLLTPEHFDLVHLHSPVNGTLPLVALASSSVPVVGTFHTSFGTSANLALFKRFAQRQIDALSAVIAVSPISLASIRQYLDVNATLIPNGIDVEQFRPWWQGEDDRLPQYRDGRINIFFIGRPDPRNGLDALIRAFARVHQQVPQTRLMIAGDGELMQHYRQMVAALLPSGAVEFLGAVRDERPQLYRTADIHVFTVERAAFSVTLLEGMASGLPIITTTWKGHEYMGKPGEHFETVRFEDDAAIERQLLALIADPEKRRALGQRARAHALSYSWSAIADRILGVYDQVLDVRRPPIELPTSA